MADGYSGEQACEQSNENAGENPVDAFFVRKPQVRPLFDGLAQWILQAYPIASIKVQRSQISFCGPKPFCWAWLPIREGIKGRPADYLVVSFGLDHEIIHLRFVDTTQAYRGRWIHHMIIGSIDDIDAQLKGWISQAYHWKNGFMAGLP